mmetsp:Transcript_6336/g.11001  ORF Transcript_6336/g.11001 Transcript_6336/m.11001 type:complete len:204 (-) Transcript_6336:945-1556(-)
MVKYRKIQVFCWNRKDGKSCLQISGSMYRTTRIIGRTAMDGGAESCTNWTFLPNATCMLLVSLVSWYAAFECAAVTGYSSLVPQNPISFQCAAGLARIGIGRVFFGCRNERFGGCGSLMHLHKPEGLPSPSHKGYPIYTGTLEKEAVTLLRSFYDRENFHAPDEKRRRKENNNKKLPSKVSPRSASANELAVAATATATASPS